MPMQTFSCSRPGRSYSPATESERRWDGRPHAQRVLVVATATGFAAIGVLAKAIPGMSQDNLVLVAFLLPVWIAWPWLSLGDAAELAFDQLRHDDFVASCDFVGKRVHIHAKLYIHVGEEDRGVVSTDGRGC